MEPEMNFLLLADVVGMLLGWLMGFLSLFLILLILIQRGKGGGLTGALGGPGGQSAFGSKAGDTFTLITVIVASVWAFTCAFTMWLYNTNVPSAAAATNIKPGPSETRPADDAAVPPIGGAANTAPANTAPANTPPAPADSGQSSSIGGDAAPAEPAMEPAAGEPAAAEPAAGEPATDAATEIDLAAPVETATPESE
jgi:preprotein translocase subunit SecG